MSPLHRAPAAALLVAASLALASAAAQAQTVQPRLAPPSTQLHPQPGDTLHRLVGPAAELKHHATHAWRNALEAPYRSDRGERQLLTQLFAFAGAADLTEDLITDHDAPRDETRAALQALDTLAYRVQRLVDTEDVEPAVETNWNLARKSLATLEERYGHTPAARPRDTDPDPDPRPDDRWDPPTPPRPEPRDPNMPWVHVVEHAWMGGFTPDLMVKGRIEGKDLDRGSVTVKDSAGRLIHEDVTSITDLIRQQVSGMARGASAVVNWTYRVDDDEMAEGNNVIRVTATDKRGNSAWSELKVTKKAF